MIPAEDVRRWVEIAADPMVGLTFLELFHEASERVRSERPLCLSGGGCCRFEQHGHRLYVTGLEAAWFLEQAEALRGRAFTSDDVTLARERGDCPALVEGRCTVHRIRPFGCRSYFCDPRATWQNEAYERWHARVKDLHEELEAPYVYAEWRELLARVLEHQGS